MNAWATIRWTYPGLPTFVWVVIERPATLGVSPVVIQLLAPPQRQPASPVGPRGSRARYRARPSFRRFMHG